MPINPPLTPITEVDNLLTQNATTAYVDAQLLLKANHSTTYSNTEVDTIAATHNTLITSATNLTVNKLITMNIEPPAGFSDITLNANKLYF